MPRSPVPGISASAMATVSKRPVASRRAATASALRRTSSRVEPGKATDGMRTRLPDRREQRDAGGAASRTASGRVRSEVMRVILSAPPFPHLEDTVAKTPAAPAPNDAPSEGTTLNGTRRGKGRADPVARRAGGRPQASARRPTRRRPRRARRPSWPRTARRRASAWPPATSGICRCATRVRSASSCATSSTRAGTWARPSCPPWCSSS